MDNRTHLGSLDHTIITTPAADQTVLDTIVERIFVIEDITMGKGGAKDFLVRYRGHLRSEDSIAAYDQISSELAPLDITPLFRKEDDGRQAIILVAGRVQPKASNPWINLLMFVLTVFSVAFTGGTFYPVNIINPASTSGIMSFLAVMINGMPYSVSLILILGAHEFAHYLVARAHGVHVSLPYFIPLPPLFGLLTFGTMGAVINMKEPPKNRRHLLDIGVAGPLAGAIVAIPLIYFGLKLSTLDTIPMHIPPRTMLEMEGNSLIYLLLKFIALGKWLPAPASFVGLPPLLYWVKYFFTGQPFPYGALDVTVHPIAMAGWVGLLVTSLNLIPVGQLDGGHAMFVLFGRKAMQRMFPVIMIILVALGFVFSGWWLWAALLFFLGRTYAEPPDQITELDSKRRWLAIAAIVLFVLVFIPIPITAVQSIVP